MTYNVFSGTLNPTQSINQSINFVFTEFIGFLLRETETSIFSIRNSSNLMICFAVQQNE